MTRRCEVCGNETFHEEHVEEVFDIDGKKVLVEGVPAFVCSRCGEANFSRETVERVRKIVHGEAKPIKQFKVDVFAYA